MDKNSKDGTRSLSIDLFIRKAQRRRTYCKYYNVLGIPVSNYEAKS